jgi:hypothetical protein
MYEIQGIDELKRALENMGNKADAIINDAANRAGETVLKNIQQRAPGNLKNGLELKKAKYGFCQVKLKKGFGYGVPVELGHRLFYYGHRTDTMIPERPYMRPGADASINDVEKIVADELDKILKEFGG